MKWLLVQELFGSRVATHFPSAEMDISEAGTCYAMGNDTACVFHLMRVVEHGLRALAKTLRVKLPRKRHIELEEWGGLIEAIETRIGEIEKRRRTRKREADLKFYHAAAAQFRHFKNAWRNHVMHGRAFYDSDESITVMRHVDEFMRHISQRLRER